MKLDLGSLLYSNPREPHTFNPPGLLCLRAAGCPPTQSLPTPTSPGGITFTHFSTSFSELSLALLLGRSLPTVPCPKRPSLPSIHVTVLSRL